MRSAFSGEDVKVQGLSSVRCCTERSCADVPRQRRIVYVCFCNSALSGGRDD